MKIEGLQQRDMTATATLRAPRGVGDSGNRVPAGGKDLPRDLARLAFDTRQAAESIDRYLREAGRQFAFSVDQVTGRTIVSIRDPATGELIRQMPSEEALRIAHNLHVMGAALVEELA